MHVLWHRQGRCMSFVCDSKNIAAAYDDGLPEARTGHSTDPCGVWDRREAVTDVTVLFSYLRVPYFSKLSFLSPIDVRRRFATVAPGSSPFIRKIIKRVPIRLVISIRISLENQKSTGKMNFIGSYCAFLEAFSSLRN